MSFEVQLNNFFHLCSVIGPLDVVKAGFNDPNAFNRWPSSLNWTYWSDHPSQDQIIYVGLITSWQTLVCLPVVVLWPESGTSTGNLTRTGSRAAVYNIWHTVGVAWTWTNATNSGLVLLISIYSHKFASSSKITKWAQSLSDSDVSAPCALTILLNTPDQSAESAGSTWSVYLVSLQCLNDLQTLSG